MIQPMDCSKAKGKSPAERLFFALLPDDAVRTAIAQMADSLLQISSEESLRRVPPQNYHLTLAFLGSVENQRVEAICNAVTGIEVPPLTLMLDRVGHFPRPKVLWIGVSRPSEAIQGLVARLWTLLKPLGFDGDSRVFRPHVTVARKARRPPAQCDLPPLSWMSESMSLMRSVNRPVSRGACGQSQVFYERIRTWPATEGGAMK